VTFDGYRYRPTRVAVLIYDDLETGLNARTTFESRSMQCTELIRNPRSGTYSLRIACLHADMTEAELIAMLPRLEKPIKIDSTC